MKNSVPRKQHFLPKFYLKEFSRGGLEHSRLVITDLQLGKQYQSSPRKAGFERDYYTLDSDDPYELEREFARLEGLIAPWYHAAIRQKTLLSPEHLAVLLRFVAILTIRTPGIRRIVMWALAKDTKAKLQRIAESPELYAELEKMLGAEGAPSLPAREELLEHLPSGKVNVEPDQTELIRQTLHVYEHIDKLLNERRWSLAVIENGDSKFVTSDTPLLLGADLNPKPGVFLQFGLPHRQIFVPLSSDVALVSRDEPPAILTAAREHVATVNGQVSAAARFLYSSSEGFDILTQQGIMNSSELLTRIRAE